ncbi:RNA polymerase sigma factor [Pseudactinotalea sp. HY158]|uniref:RNA polymerase sigma factor n=1 Tax=Pseudactinotalea sp. HY158 TaxID=2654547 RepID=UPI00129C7769|nr:RNA polymerase sigma factor [Pseudactinotalea sp. HY158]QGH69414.1 sigma-70 family RNA polymerase sigma factor [Pseudactinotalea sp. HY158]
MTGRPEAQRFAHLWDECSGRVLAYAIRHVGPDLAEEVVAETFLIAWRRLAVVPGEPLPWLLVVARNTIRSHRRSSYRRRALETELARLERSTASGVGVDVHVVERDVLLRGLAQLGPRQREALLLIAWDGLSYEQAAAVAGCSLGAFKVRVHRARDRLRREIDTPRSAGADSPGTGSIDTLHGLLPEGRTS